MNDKTKNRARNTNINQKNARVFSYYSSNTSRPEKIQSSTPETKKPTKNNRFRYLPTFMALLVIAGSCVYASLLNTNNPKIVQLADRSELVLRPDSEYQNGAAEVLGESIWSKSKLTINSDMIAQKLREKYPELSLVGVTIPIISKRPIIELSPAVPTLLVRGRNGTFAVGDDGRALSSTSEIGSKASEKLIKVNDSLDIEVKQGDYVLPKRTVTFIKEVDSQLSKKNQNIESITLPAVANELHVKVAGQPYYIKFNLQNDVLQQVGSYLALIDSGQQLAKEYIDVRVDGRVYYK